MKVIFKFSVVILVNLLVNSCIQEQRVYPKQPTSGSSNTSTSSGNSSSSGSSNNSNSNNTNTNTNTSSKINYVNLYNYSYTEGVDSNFNQYYSSFRLNLSFRTFMGSKIKYSVYASTFSSSNSSSTYALIYESPLINNYNNDVIYFSRKLKADSIINLPTINYYLNFNNYQSNGSQTGIYFYFVVQDSANNYYNYQTSTSYSSATYSNQPNFISITNYSFDQIETNAKDRTYSIYNNYSMTVYNGIDNNSNGSIQQPTQFLTYFYTTAQRKSAYYKIYYSKNYSTNFLLYGTTTSYNLSSSNYSGTVIDVGTPAVNLTSGGYYFKVEAYDSKTDELLLSSSSNSTVGIESLVDDQRTYSLGYVKLIKNEDNDNDGYPSTYYLKIKVNSSDNMFPSTSTSTLNINIANYGSSYYQTMLSRSNLTFSDTVSVLVSGGTGYAKSYYDFGLNVSFNNRTVISTDASQNANLRQIKLERTTED